ncbi:MAG: heavy metal translocating P-type ATPase metal-binding domain-containing protein [Flavobacteriales bacterium]|nr:heavy metal translocating P-type ATPase metal-binding domain-containing protein [Flavobacteriales bacterium]
MPALEKNATCYHCNDDCTDETIHLDGRTFCCNGCSTVYQLLKDVGLDETYANGPLGIKPNVKKAAELAYLDDAEVKESLLDFSDGTLARISFELPAIHCSACVYLLERLERLNKGVKQCEVNFPKKTANILFDQTQVSLKELVLLLHSIGYAPHLNLAKSSEAKDKPTVDRTLLFKIGVAGFCFGNIMLLSFPEYLVEGFHLETKWSTLFNYMNLALALPVLLYAGRDYLVSAYKGLKVRHVNMDVPVSIGILAIFGRSAFDIISGAGPGFLDSLAGFVFFLLIGKWYQAKTYSGLSFERDYKSFFPIAVNRVGTDGQVSAIMIKHLLEGDEIQIHNDELIPCDCELLSERASIDYSFVTGEAAPSSKLEGNRIYAGGKNRGSIIRLKVLKPVSSSYLTSLWNSSEASQKEERPPLLNFSNKIASWFSAAVLSVAALTAIYWLIVDPTNWLNTTTAVLIIACPCATALTIPFTYGSMLRHFGRHGFFVRSVEAIAKMGQINHVVFDKTGTITIRKGDSVHFSGNQVTDEQLVALVNVARQSLHPLSKTFASAFPKTEREPVVGFVENAGIGIYGMANGVLVELQNPNKLPKADKARFDSWQSETHGMGRTAVLIDGYLHARVDFSTSYRVGLHQTIEKLKAENEIFLLSGDNDTEAVALSNNLIAGFEKDHMLFNMDPHEKKRWITEKQATNEAKVLMVGDGLNDAGALKEAHFGISVAEDNSQFTPASDGILTANSFQKLPDFITLSRQARNIVIAAFSLSMIYNVVGVSIAVQGLLSPVVAAILMPLSSVTIVLFTTVSSAVLVRRRLKQTQ